MKNTGKKLVIFIVPDLKVVNGGIMSIFSLASESRKLKELNDSEVLVCTYIGTPSYKKNDLFDNSEYVFDFDEIISQFPSPSSVLIHVPELIVYKLSEQLRPYASYLSAIKDLRINIMNQNIMYMPTAENILDLYQFTPTITQTTAHDKYSTQEISDKYALPLKHLSVLLDPSNYSFTSFDKKQDIIAYSSDNKPYKANIIKLLEIQFPNFKFVEIKNMSFTEYKEVARDAKFMITFGEGMDGYFIESTFSGGIPIAIYNTDFFPDSSYASLKTVYSDEKDMQKNIMNDITELLSNSVKYETYNKNIFNKLAVLYGRENFISKLRGYYRGAYDFYPTYKGVSNSILIPLKHVLDNQSSLKSELSDLQNKLNTSSAQLNSIVRSKSWYITKPLRYITKIRKHIRQ